MSEMNGTGMPRKPVKSRALNKNDARENILRRLRRAEGQIRGIQRMLEKEDDCLSIGQQFSAVRKALDSTYLLMTVCFAEQEIETIVARGDNSRESKDLVLKDLEGMLARIL